MEAGSRHGPTSRSSITSCRRRTSVASPTNAAIRGGVEPAAERLPESHPEARRLRAAGGVRADELLAMFNAMRDERRPYHNDFVKMMVNLVPMLADAIHGL